MKNNRKYNPQFLIGFLALFITITSCKEQSNFGMEIFPKDDLISVKNVVVKDEISSFMFRDDSVRTDESARSLLGSFDDPVFGTTTVDFATQFRLQFFPDYGESPHADSVLLYLYYRSIYGDTLTTQKLKVYELESSLDVDASYYHDVDLKSLASDYLLGEAEYTPRVSLDTLYADTLYQLIIIPLDISLAEKLISADSTQMINNDVFLEYFKGLYIESVKVTEEGGTILSLDAVSNDVFQGSALVVYYNNEETREIAEGDSSLSMPFVITNFSARVNSFSHDYSETVFEDNLNMEIENDTLIYVQATGGLKSKILIDGLTSWKDSVNIAINKAELVFQIDTIPFESQSIVEIAPYPLDFAPPQQLLLTVADENGKEFLPIDYLFSPINYGGYLRSDFTYHFNITQHLQQILDGNAGNYGFYLTPANKNSEANRVVLKGSTSQTGIKLLITYSKFTN
ncbi:MAG: DUF4270 family protein [Draconibacterium sp.]|nr:DUF4270 family protein [Draconibacterium sp.]